MDGTHRIPMDSPTYPTWESRIGWTVGSRWMDGTHRIPMDSLSYPTRYSRMGQTVGFRPRWMVHIGFQWTVTPISRMGWTLGSIGPLDGTKSTFIMYS